jgi:hypothetical protein
MPDPTTPTTKALLLEVTERLSEAVAILRMLIASMPDLTTQEVIDHHQAVLKLMHKQEAAHGESQ